MVPAPGTRGTSVDIGADLPVTPNGVTVSADMDSDGDLDLMLANISPYGGNFLDIYRNDGGAFAAADTGLAHVRYGMADWGDADNDGDLDVVYAGNIDLPDGTGETVVRILINDGAGGYTPLDVTRDFAGPDEPWLDFSAVSWADYDSDGDVDLLVGGEWLGTGEIFGRALVYVNDGGTFTPSSDLLPGPIAGNAGGAFTWFDVDGDGDLDYFVAGGYYVENGNGLIEARTQLFRNDAVQGNSAPSVPAGLHAVVANAAVTLAWDGATDDSTPADALTYDLEIVALGTPSAAERALPEAGNVSRNASWVLRGLPDGTYAWSVRAVDSAFNASAKAQGTFAVGTVAVPEEEPTRRLFALSAAQPNPSRETGEPARFSLSLDRAQPVTVAVFDIRGRRAALLHDGPLAAGVHGFSLAGADLPSGTYFVRATSGVRLATQRVTVVR